MPAYEESDRNGYIATERREKGQRGVREEREREREKERERERERKRKLDRE